MQKIGKLYWSYVTMACDILLIVAMIVFLLKYRKTMQVMLAAFYKQMLKTLAYSQFKQIR